MNIKVADTYSYHCFLKSHLVVFVVDRVASVLLSVDITRFKVSVTKQSVTDDWKASNSRMVVNNGLERMWKDAVVV
jgi:hypothetical protein